MRRTAALLLLIAAGTVLAACSSGSARPHHGSPMGSMTGSSSVEKNSPVVPGALEISVTSKAYSFTPKLIRVAAGTNLTLALTATDIPHDLTVEGVGHIAHARRDKTTRGGLKIMKPGTYVFYCSVQGHRAAGMTGKIIVS
jgi:Heme/copper-type cytochrome/quinol oxidases, subunit 2